MAKGNRLLMSQLTTNVTRHRQQNRRQPLRLRPKLNIIRLANLHTATRLHDPTNFELTRRATTNRRRQITLLNQRMQTNDRLVKRLRRPLFPLPLIRIMFLRRHRGRHLIARQTTMINRPIINLTYHNGSHGRYLTHTQLVARWLRNRQRLRR